MSNRGSAYKGYGRAYTQEEDDWLRVNIEHYDYPTLTKLFNERFGRNLKSVADHCTKQLHIHRPVNKGDFKKGVRACTTTVPIGSESWDGRCLWLKISDDMRDYSDLKNPSSKRYNHNWVLKSAYIWEQQHGPIPKGHVVVHLNMDRKDCSPENLYCTTRQINFMLAKNGWYTEDPVLTLTAIKWCELFYALKKESKYEV